MTATDEQRLLLGMDIGGTKTVVVLARADGEILAESRLEGWACGEWQEDVHALVDHAAGVLRREGVEGGALRTIGLSVPGPLDLARGRVIEAPNLPGWLDVPLVDRIAQAFDTRVVLENDANAAALAEWRFGAGQGTRHMLYLTLSTGLGGGLILDGRLYRGASYQAGEVGHMPIVPGGRPCNCGLRGCLEAYVGGAALAEIIREDIAGGESTALLEMADGDPKHVSARLWVDAIRASDEYALRLRDRFLGHLSQGLAALLSILDPECVVLGTIVQKNAELFLDDLVMRVRARTWPSLHHVRIEPGRLGERLPAYAALCVASLEPPDSSASGAASR